MMRDAWSWTRLSRETVVLTALLALGCAENRVEAPASAHPPGDATSVPYPPPPAKVEELPALPRDGCVWIDGYWEFSDRWEWQPGEWVVPPAHCKLAPVELRRQGGQLWHARPRWYPEKPAPLGPQSACPRPPPCVAISAAKGDTDAAEQ